MEKRYSGWPEWELIEKIGEGSFGKVYRAKRAEGTREFYSAIKIITISGDNQDLNELGMDRGDEQTIRTYLKEIVDDCVTEIEVMESLKGHSNIVVVDDFKVIEHPQGIGWDIHIRMELLESFVDYSRKHRMDQDEVLRLGTDLCQALELCEKKDIIHRDIKPANVFVSSTGSFKLGDFGIARKLERANGTMSQKGTYSYMAPEVFYGRKYDSTIDLYSLGIMLYQLLNHNRAPFVDPYKTDLTYRDKEEAMRRRMNGEPMSPPCEASPQMAEVILCACSYHPQQRYRNAAQMRQDLERIRQGREPERRSMGGWTEERTQAMTGQPGFGGGTYTPPNPAPKKSKSSLGLIIAAAAVAVIAAGFLFAKIFLVSGSDKEAEPAAAAEAKEEQNQEEEPQATPTEIPSPTAEPEPPAVPPEVSQPETSPSYKTYYVVNCQESITLRTSPSTSASEICQIPLGAAVSYVEGAENGFYKIIYNGNTGYGLASYLSTEPSQSRSQANTVNYPIYYVVNCQESITLRTSPSTSASEICQIPLGAAVSYVEGAENGFYKIIYNGNTGYGLASYLSSVPQSQSRASAADYPIYYVVNCNESITLRTSPSTSASEICQIPLGAAVSYVEGAGNGFYKVVYNGNTGYALASYLSSDTGGSGFYARVVHCNESITLRTSPSTSASEICQIPLNSIVYAYEWAGNGFYRVEFNGQVGYALADYLEGVG